MKCPWPALRAARAMRETDAIVIEADDPIAGAELEALMRTVAAKFEDYVKLNKKISPEVVGAAGQIDDYSKLADTVAFD